MAATLTLDAPGQPSSYRLDDMGLVVELDDEAVGYRFDDLRDVEVLNDVVSGVELAIVVDPESLGGWTVFARRADGRTLTLSRGER